MQLQTQLVMKGSSFDAISDIVPIFFQGVADTAKYYLRLPLAVPSLRSFASQSSYALKALKLHRRHTSIKFLNIFVESHSHPIDPMYHI